MILIRSKFDLAVNDVALLQRDLHQEPFNFGKGRALLNE